MPFCFWIQVQPNEVKIVNLKMNKILCYLFLKINLHNYVPVQKIVNRQFKQKSDEFRKRYPRDHRYVSKNWLKFSPKPSKMVSDQPKTDQQIHEIFDSVDENGDKATDPWELHDWMVYVESLAHKYVLDEQWHNLGLDDWDNITWSDYSFQVSNAHLQSEN